MNIRPRFNLLALILMITLLSSSFFVSPQSQANSNYNATVNIRVFFDALSPYGVWVNHPVYGEVWYPNDVASDWRPYTDGYWANTDEYGWLWVADEPWGWAPFHYGRWAWDDWYGWIWVPGNVWAPAWVFWRSGEGYAAWSPMPPNVVWQPGVGLNTSYFDYDRDLPWYSWIIVRDYDLPRRHIREHIFPSQENREIINRTHNTHNLSWNHNTIVNEGIPVREIETITKQPIEHIAPTVHDRIIDYKNRHTEGQPDIIRLPMAASSSQEIKQNEELARRLDGKRPDGTRTEQPVMGSIQPNNQDTRLPGRLVGIHRQPPTTFSDPNGNNSYQSPVPESPIGRNPRTFESAQQPSVNIRESIPVPIVEQQQMQIQQQQAERAQQEAQQRQLQESTRQQETQQQMQIQQQQVERAQQEAQQRQLQESTRQQETQQQMQIQQQQVERAQQEAQQRQLQEPTRQQETQQQMQIQRQQSERAQQEAQQQQRQLQESARQQEAQQQMQIQQQQAERAQQEAQQRQLQESARQQETQQQMQIQQQQAERAQQEAQQQQRQLQESARQQEAQQQMQIQQQQAERAQQEAQQQQRQLQESARQQEAQQQMQIQQQQAERARKEAEQRGANVGDRH